MELRFYFMVLIIGLALLLKAAGTLVDSSSRIARYLGISPLIIGLTIVSIGTSAPELSVSVIAAIKGSGNLSLGNIIGSNIANICLVLGLAALITPILVERTTLIIDAPFMLGSSLLLFFLLFFYKPYVLTRLAGIILLFFFFMFMVYTAILSLKQRRTTRLFREFEKEFKMKKKSFLMHCIFIVLSIIGVVLGAELTVDSSILIAEHLGINEAIISLSIIAIGTSLPELVTSVVAALKKEGNIALGNVIGSCVFNTLMIVGISALTRPLQIVPRLIVDTAIMLIISTIFLLFILHRLRLSRVEGTLLFVIYLMYMVYLVFETF